jgi:phosphate:Na+ symporter
MDAKLWLVFGGIGLFLIGMHLMETALGQLAGRDFKLLLRRNTSSNIRALLSGTLTTALLQSSSVVSFMTLAFVGSGLIRMVNALAVVLGANIGTTISNWIVATLGFSINLDVFWYLLLGLAGILLVVAHEKKKFEQAIFFCIGLSFLFIALGLMKTGMLSTVEKFDFAPYRNLPPLFFVFIGFGLTFLIQSSNATMAITLSAAFAGVIPFPLAAAVIIGSELGTSLKLVLAAAGGAAEKKQLAAGNILLNLLTTILAFIFLYPLISLVQDVIGIRNPLQGLVAFQMVINLATTLLFFPFLHPVSRWLEKKFNSHDDRSTLYIDADVPSMPAFAQEIFRLETFYFLKRVIAYHAAEFQISPKEGGLDALFVGKEKDKEEAYHALEDRYADIKKAHGELIEYYVKMQKQRSHPEELIQMNQLMKSAHSAMYAAKGFKDISHNKEELLQSGNDIKYGQFSRISNIIRANLARLSGVLALEDHGQISTALGTLIEEIQKAYKELLGGIYDKADRNAMPEKDISTLQNMNRELYSSNKSLIYAMADFLLSPEEAERIRNLPLTVR